MRNESEILKLILHVAETDERIRAVFMNGSRTNPNVDRDEFRDFDIVYVVTDTKSFLENKEWISIFGDAAIVQEPDLMDAAIGKKVDFCQSYTWLMLFKDSSRIDLQIRLKEVMNYTDDKLTLALLDKDGILPPIPPPIDKDYWIKRPNEMQYYSCCNEFWWCLNNVAKGIVRDQLPYVMWMYHVIVQCELVRMLEWHVGVSTGFSLSVGKQGKMLKKYLSRQIYEMYEKTYSTSVYAQLWSSIFTACALFGLIAADVGKHLGYTYNISEETNIIAYLKTMKSMKSKT